MQIFLISGCRSVRLFISALVVLAGLSILLMQASIALRLLLEAHLWQALRAGSLCALGTALGALLVLFLRSISGWLSDSLMGFGAGVMLAATVFSLLMPGLAAAGELGFLKWAAGALMSFGLLLGAACSVLARCCRSRGWS
jgi:ZIP family zinc transporter